MDKVLEKILSDLAAAPRKHSPLFLRLGLWEGAFFRATSGRGMELFEQIDTPLSTYAHALQIEVWASGPYSRCDVAHRRGRRLKSRERKIVRERLPKTLKVASIYF